MAAIPSQNVKLSPVAIEEVFQPTFAIEHSVQKSFHVANMSDENYVSPNHLHDGEQVNVINGNYKINLIVVLIILMISIIYF